MSPAAAVSRIHTAGQRWDGALNAFAVNATAARRSQYDVRLAARALDASSHRPNRSLVAVASRCLTCLRHGELERPMAQGDPRLNLPARGGSGSRSAATSCLEQATALQRAHRA
jgi:hypothetical protein